MLVSARRNHFSLINVYRAYKFFGGRVNFEGFHKIVEFCGGILLKSIADTSQEFTAALSVVNLSLPAALSTADAFPLL